MTDSGTHEADAVPADAPAANTIGAALASVGTDRGTLEVVLSHQIITLLSEQLYESPLKAVEELVVNSYDADASECRVTVPFDAGAVAAIAIWDSGIGMNREGLVDLWHVGDSTKRQESVEKARKRKQIGRFGIGKLATYAVANRITYISRADGEILTTTLDYTQFKGSATGSTEAVHLPVRSVTVEEVLSMPGVTDLLGSAGVEEQTLSAATWTLVLLEDLKEKASALSRGRLRWVLSTAMPLKADFKILLNNDEIVSSKAKPEAIATFNLSELKAFRLESLKETTGSTWKIDGDALKNETTFKEGITGEVLVSSGSLFGGKSADLERSHGFFVRVRSRLVNLDDPLFGLDPLSLQVFNRFRADITADELDSVMTASREGIEQTSTARADFQAVLAEVYGEARSRYDAWVKKQKDKHKTDREEQRVYVMPELLERPLADAIVADTGFRDSEPADTHEALGAEADDGWFYLADTERDDVDELVTDLYSDKRKQKYTYERTARGETGRLVRLDVKTATFQINEDHPFVQAYGSVPDAQPLLEDLITAEALLEVYLRTSGVSPAVTGEILQRRDLLFQSLSQDRIFSVAGISRALRSSTDNEHDLEVALVVAARALGFVAKHVGLSGGADGIARFIDHPNGEIEITLEAKSSKEVPSLGAIDFAGLDEHVRRANADGCLLIAPSYPGSTKEEDSAAANRAEALKISCWTVGDLARVVEEVHARHISARDVLTIVRTKFQPQHVAEAVNDLLSAANPQQQALYCAVIDALRDLEDRLPDAPRTIDLIAGEVTRVPEFKSTKKAPVLAASRELAAASQGTLVLRDERLVLNASLDEIERRVSPLLGRVPPARRASTLRKP